MTTDRVAYWFWLANAMNCHAGPGHGKARLFENVGWLCDACWTWIRLRGVVPRAASSEGATP